MTKTSLAEVYAENHNLIIILYMRYLVLLINLLVLLSLIMVIPENSTKNAMENTIFDLIYESVMLFYLFFLIQHEMHKKISSNIQIVQPTRFPT